MFTEADLSADQKTAWDAILKWISTRPYQMLTFGGYAGTGKTTLLSLLGAVSPVNYIAFAAYTGKASSVLARKLKAAGVVTSADCKIPGKHYCGTIHSLLYAPFEDPRTGEILGWRKRTKFPDHIKLIVIDEASMVTDDMVDDLRGFERPIL